LLGAVFQLKTQNFSFILLANARTGLRQAQSDKD